MPEIAQNNGDFRSQGRPNVNQQNDNSSAHPPRGSNNAQANPPNNIEGNYHSDLGVNQNMQSVDAQNNLNQSDGDVNYHDQSVGGFSKHDEKSKHKPKKKVTVIADDFILKHKAGNYLTSTIMLLLRALLAQLSRIWRTI